VNRSDPKANRHLVGWSWVALQAILLVLLVLLPRRSDWPTPSWLVTAGFGLIVVGLGVIAAAALGLGRSLTPTPVPVGYGKLTTTGLYRLVRHPIYSGVLAIVVGLGIRSGSVISGAVAVATVIFFNRKAAWEEARLAEHYPEYPAYAAVTPRFIPRPRRSAGG
jgi:protein-S-isoprenylcysteine O-methyltransferase Ste14